MVGLTLLVTTQLLQAGFWERAGVCATFEKGPKDAQTRLLAQGECLLTQGSGTGVYAQSFVWTDGTEFQVHAENYNGTPHLEFQAQDGPAFHSTEDLYDFSSCYITPKETALQFHCFRANDE